LTPDDQVAVIGCPASHGPTAMFHHNIMKRLMKEGLQKHTIGIHKDSEQIYEQHPKIWNENDTVIISRRIPHEIKIKLVPRGVISVFYLAIEHEASAKYQQKNFWGSRLYDIFLQDGIREKIFRWSNVEQPSVIPGIYHMDSGIRYPIYFDLSSVFLIPNSASHLISLLDNYNLWRENYCVIPWQEDKFNFFTIFDALEDYSNYSETLHNVKKLLTEGSVAEHDLIEIGRILEEYAFDCFLMFPTQEHNSYISERKDDTYFRLFLKRKTYGLNMGGFLDLFVENNADDKWKSRERQEPGERSGESSSSSAEDEGSNDEGGNEVGNEMDSVSGNEGGTESEEEEEESESEDEEDDGSESEAEEDDGSESEAEEDDGSESGEEEEENENNFAVGVHVLGNRAVISSAEDSSVEDDCGSKCDEGMS
jgi:hypothetical protein